MNNIEGRLNGPLAFCQDSTFHGLINGNVSVREGVEFILYGMVNGDLHIEQGGKVTVHGFINGEICNNGGTINFHGVKANMNPAI